MWKSEYTWVFVFTSDLKYYFVSVNYQKNWQCAAVLKADAQASNDSTLLPPITSASTGQQGGTKYYKRGTISHPSQVPWH
jgi:nucleoporin SEH1